MSELSLDFCISRRNLQEEKEMALAELRRKIASLQGEMRVTLKENAMLSAKLNLLKKVNSVTFFLINHSRGTSME